MIQLEVRVSMEEGIAVGSRQDSRDTFIEQTSLNLILHPALAALVASTVCETPSRGIRGEKSPYESDQD